MKPYLYTGLFMMTSLCACILAGTNIQAQNRNTSPGHNRPSPPATVTRTGTTPDVAPAAGQLAPEVLKFKKYYAIYAKNVITAQELIKKYPDAAEDEKERITAQLENLSVKIPKMHSALLKIAETAYAADSSSFPELDIFVTEVLEIYLLNDNYEKLYQLLRPMFSKKFSKKLPDIYNVAGITCFALNLYDQAEKYFTLAEKYKVLSENGKTYRDLIPHYKMLWAREKTLRSQDSARKDLPQILISTSKGDITVELFENEAPNTVANFISLAEKGFYDNSLFHRVIPGAVAQCGAPLDNPNGGPGYTIPDELKISGTTARPFLRGTLGMVNNGPNTAGSQFFITFMPMKELDGKYTAFGRVINGMDVLADLQRIDPNSPDPMIEPDSISSMLILRKRPHEYIPKKNKISGSAAAPSVRKKSPSTPELKKDLKKSDSSAY